MNVALCNAVSKQRVFLKSAETLKLATSQDDSIPRLLMAMITLRRLMIQNTEDLNLYLSQFYETMGLKYGIGECDECEWYRYGVKDDDLHHRYHLYTWLQRCATHPETWIYEVTEIHTISYYYDRILDFCKKYYTQKSQYADILFLFIDIHNIIESSSQHYPSGIHTRIQEETEAIIRQMKQEIVSVIQQIWDSQLTSHSVPQDLDLSQLLKFVVIIQHYPVISYPSCTYELVFQFFFIVVFVLSSRTPSSIISLSLCNTSLRHSHLRFRV